MAAPITNTLLITGRFSTETFSEWIIRCATKLSLVGWVRAIDDSQLEICVSGDLILIEALEVACSLGPFDATVDSIDMHPTASHQLRYRHPTQFVRY